MSLLRPISPGDHQAVLELNERNVELLAPLDEARLVELLGWADVGAVVEVAGEVAGFVLTFVSGSAYDGENFAWFAERYESFAYLDRVVIGDRHRRRGLATRVYDDLERSLDREVLGLEVNLDPPNEPSLAFHRARGFAEIGARPFAGHMVTMMVKPL